MSAQPIIHIAYAEDHTLVRKGIISFINNLGGIEVDIDVDNGRDLVNEIAKANRIPDVCLLDINMPGMNGFDTVIELKKRWPHIKILVLTVFDIEIYIVRMIMIGANGYLLKSCNPEEIKEAIVSIFCNGMYFSELVTHNFVQDIKTGVITIPNLTGREMQVLKYSCSELNYAQIAEKLGTTTRSVEGYRDSLFRKLKVHNRVSLALFAVQFGLVQMEMTSYDDGKFLNKKIQKKYF